MTDQADDLPLVSKTGILVDLTLSAVFFLFMKWVLAPHVPSEDPTAILIVSSMTSFCMTGVFWIACNMFRVTLVDYQRRQAAQYPAQAANVSGDEKSPKGFVPTLLLCLLIGTLGIHRFYVGKIGTGIAMIFTCGGLGIWSLIDLIMIAMGKFTDAEGRIIKN
jgi:TM2 domain-containing membrane protein YozV